MEPTEAIRLLQALIWGWDCEGGGSMGWVGRGRVEGGVG